MNKTPITLSLAAVLIAASGMAVAWRVDSGMSGMHMAVPDEAQGVGVVQAIDTAKGTIRVHHQPIPSIQWPAMVMDFKVVSPALLKSVKVGERVRFGLHLAGMTGTVTWIKPAK